MAPGATFAPDIDAAMGKKSSHLLADARAPLALALKQAAAKSGTAQAGLGASALRAATQSSSAPAAASADDAKLPRSATVSASAAGRAIVPPAHIHPAESFAALSGFRRALKDAAAQREHARREAAQRVAQALADADMFRRAVGAVIPLMAPERAPLHTPPRPLPLPLKTRMDEREVLIEALSDAYDPDAMLEIDDSLSFKRHGVARDVVRKLRRGTWVVQSQIDLHGCRTDEAREAMSLFIRDAAKRGLRCVRVIHGKGLGSTNKEPVLKGKVRAWLAQKSEVMAFVEARERDGGAGAVVVLLQTQQRHHG